MFLVAKQTNKKTHTTPRTIQISKSFWKKLRKNVWRLIRD
jgi:hypothetical protein